MLSLMGNLENKEDGAPSVKDMVVEDPRNFNIYLDPRIPLPTEKTGAAEDTIYILVDGNDPNKFLKIGSQLSPMLRKMLMEFLLKNLDIFALSLSDMVGIDPEVMCHHLNIYPNRKGVRQKRPLVS